MTDTDETVQPTVQRGAAGMPEAPAPSADLPSYDDLEEAMRDVVDPELGINVVDLGLLYGIDVHGGAEDGAGPVVTLDMTLTSAACPLTDVIEDQCGQALEGLVASHRINWVWMPPWGPERITDDGRDMMRALGFAI